MYSAIEGAGLDARCLRRGVPEFLQARYAGDHEVVELTWLDRTPRCAFEGENADPLSGEMLGALDWEHACLCFAPTLCLHPVATNAAVIWGALAEETVQSPAERLPEAASLRVWRAGLSPRYRTIDVFETAIERLQVGETFGTVCEAISEELDEAAATHRIGTMLSIWIQDGLIVGAKGKTA